VAWSDAPDELLLLPEDQRGNTATKELQQQKIVSFTMRCRALSGYQNASTLKYLHTITSQTLSTTLPIIFTSQTHRTTRCLFSLGRCPNINRFVPTTYNLTTYNSEKCGAGYHQRHSPLGEFSAPLWSYGKKEL